MSEKFVLITFEITSKIKYLDGHFENGPSSSRIAYKVKTMEAIENALNTTDNILDKLYKKAFGNKFYKGFQEFFIGDDDEARSNTPKEIIFYIHRKAVGSNDHIFIDENFEITKVAP